MTDSLSKVLRIPDARLAAEAVSARPVWLWTEDGARLLWANPAAVTVFGADTVTALSTPSPAQEDPHRQQIMRLAPRISETSQLQRLRGFGARAGGLMTCACLRLTIENGDTAVAVTAIDPVWPSLSLTERLAMLVRDLETPVAAYSTSGELLGASRAAPKQHIDDIALHTAEAATARASALRDGHAELTSQHGVVTLHRIGHGGHDNKNDDGNGGLIAVWPQHAGSTADIAPAPKTESAETPAPRTTPAQPQRPMRFLWQMDAQNRFSLGSDGFSRLIGLATTAAFGRPWHEINAALNLDPENKIAHAIATRNTFSGLKVMWPLDGTDIRLPVTLSALPVLDHDNRFVGYQGFGVCNDLDLLAQVGDLRRDQTLRRLQRVPVPPPHDAPVAPVKTASGAAPTDETKSASATSPVLTPVENSTFNELGRQLSERLEHPDSQSQNTSAHPEDAPSPEQHNTLPDAERLAEDLSAILDVVNDSAITFDADGQINACNRSAETLFGYANGDIAKHTVFDLLMPDAHRAVRDAIAAVIDAETPASHIEADDRRINGRSIDGSPIPLSMTIGRSAHQDASLFAVFQDMRPRKQHAAELYALRQQVERANRARTDMLEWVSHEVRTPTDTIAGYADVMLDEKFGAAGNERYSAHLRDIRGAARQITTTLNEMRDLAHIESGDFEFNMAPQNLNTIVEQSIASMQATASDSRVVIRPALGHSLPTVTADIEALRLIAGNLIGLSIHLAQAGGQVIVSTLLSDSGKVMLRVRDTGEALDALQIAAISDTSRPLNTASHPRLAKSGINLPLTRALIQANHAHLGIRTAPNSGTLIEVTFAAV